MYKITLYDDNLPSIVSGTCAVYCDDIDEFEREWTSVEKHEGVIARFRKSKAGEIVTDYYSDNPELNIVQFDDACEIFYETDLTMDNFELEVSNVYGWPTDLYGRRADYKIRYVKFQGEYLRLGKFKLYGVCSGAPLAKEKYERTYCWGNRFLKSDGRNSVEYSDNMEDFKDYTIESFVYYELESFETIEEMKKMYMSERGNQLTQQDLQRLLADIPGEAG